MSISERERQDRDAGPRRRAYHMHGPAQGCRLPACARARPPGRQPAGRVMTRAVRRTQPGPVTFSGAIVITSCGGGQHLRHEV